MNVASLLVISQKSLRPIKETLLNLDLGLGVVPFLLHVADDLVHDWLIRQGFCKCLRPVHLKEVFNAVPASLLLIYLL